MKKLFYLFLFMLAGCCAWAMAEGETTTPAGYKISGKITFTDKAETLSLSGTIVLKKDGVVKETISYKSTETFDYTAWMTTISAPTYAFENLAAGTYTLEVDGEVSSVYGTASESVTVDAADVTQDVALTHDKTKAWMTIVVKNADKDQLEGVSVKIGNDTKTTNNQGRARFLCTVGTKYTVVCSKANSDYETKTVADLDPNEAEANGEIKGKTHEITLNYNYELITIKGKVTPAPKGLYVALTRNGEELDGAVSEIAADGSYTLEDVPNKGTLAFYVSEDKWYPIDEPSKQWGFAGGESLEYTVPAGTAAGAEVTKDLTIVRKGVEVLCLVMDKVNDVNIGDNMTVKMGDTRPKTKYVNNVAYHQFQGVQAGEVTISLTPTAKTEGKPVTYNDVNETFTVGALANLSIDTVITRIVRMMPNKIDHKFYGTAYISQGYDASYNEIKYYLSGAKVVMYKNGEKVAETTADENGFWVFAVNGYASDDYTFAITHDSIEDWVSSSASNIYPSYDSTSVNLYFTRKNTLPGIENLKAEQITIAGKQGVKLSWAWPSELTENYGEDKKYEISMVNIYRQIPGDNSSWVNLRLVPGEDGALPLPEYIDTASNPALKMGKAYNYTLSIQYVAPESKAKSAAPLTITLLSSEAVTLKGNVSISGQENATLNGGLWLAIESGDELALAEIKEGKYEFKDVKLNGILHYNLLSKAETETANLEQNRSKNWKFGNKKILEYTLTGADTITGVFTNNISIKRVAATVRGTIKDQRTNQYMEAYARIGTDTVRTNSNGLFAIEGMAEGEHTVWMWAKGYEGPISKTITVPDLLTILPNDFNEYVDTVLVPKNEARVFFGELSYMNSANEAVKIAGAKVEMYEVGADNAETKLEETTTGADGKFEFSKTCQTNTTYKFKASHERMENAVSNLVYANDTRVEVRIHCTMKKVELLGMENPKATQKENEMSVDLSWSWPAALVSNYKTTYLIRNIVVKRICGTDTTEVGSVTPDSTELPATKFTDSKDLKQDETYTYFFVMNYVKPVDSALVVANPALTVKMVVKTDTTANEEFELSAWKAYANNGTLTLVSSTPCQYGVYTSTGALVEQGRMSEGEHRVSVKQTGVYVVRRISQTGISVRKVFVK